MNRFGPVLALSLSVLASCSSTDRADELAFLDELAARHAEEVEAFEAEKKAFLARTELPQRHDFPDLGTVFIRGARLTGWPAKAFLRVEYTYLNTTGHRIPTPRITVTAEDPETGQSSSTSMELAMPVGVDMTTDSSYTSWLDVPLDGMHQRPGWDWNIALGLAGDS